MNLYNTAGVIMIILVLMVVVLVFNILLNLLETYLMRWRPPGAGIQGGMGM